MSNSSSWKDRIRSATTRIPEARSDNAFLEVLNDFVATLRENPWVDAEIQQSATTSGFTLITRPKYRRDMRTPMIQFWIGPRSVAASAGTERQELANKEQLEEYLADFVEKSHFPQTIAIYEQIQKEDVEGRLRGKALFESDDRDVVVVVPAAQHNELAARTLRGETESPIGVSVELLDHPAAGKLDEHFSYPYLESGGFGLRLPPQGVTRLGKLTAKCHGTVVPLVDLEPDEKIAGPRT